MVIWLLFSLILVILVLFVWNGRSIFSPTIIVASSFLLSVTILLANWKFFGFEDISPKCYFIVLSSLFFMGFGEILAKSIIQKKGDYFEHNRLTDRPNLSIRLRISKVFFYFICAVGIYIIIARGLAVYKVSIELGNTGGFLDAFSYARRYVNSGNSLEISRLITYPAVFVKACALYFMYIFLHNKTIFGKSSFCLLLPAILYSIYTLTSTARTGIIEIGSAFLIMNIVFTSRKKENHIKTNSKMVKITILVTLFLVSGFIIAGNIRSISDDENSASDIVNYSGSPLIVFSRWLEKKEKSPFVGYSTIPDLINILYRLGITDRFVSYEEIYPPEDVLASSRSNLKTWLKAPIQDFSISGMLFSRFFLGLIYTFLINYLLTKKETHRHIGGFIFGSLLFYPLLSAAIADKFGNYLQLETLYLAIIFAIFSRKSHNSKSSLF